MDSYSEFNVTHKLTSEVIFEGSNEEVTMEAASIPMARRNNQVRISFELTFVYSRLAK